MVTGLWQVDTVVQARKLGARDFISKPVEPDELKLVVISACWSGGSCYRYVGFWHLTAASSGIFRLRQFTPWI